MYFFVKKNYKYLRCMCHTLFKFYNLKSIITAKKYLEFQEKKNYNISLQSCDIWIIVLFLTVCRHDPQINYSDGGSNTSGSIIGDYDHFASWAKEEVTIKNINHIKMVQYLICLEELIFFIILLAQCLEFLKGKFYDAVIVSLFYQCSRFQITY